MSESKRPWKAVRDPCHYHTLSSIVDADGAAVAEVTGEDMTVQGENTLLIVRSVNSRDLAVEAMEEALRHLDVGIPEGRHLHTIAKLRTALAAMKGEGNG